MGLINWLLGGQSSGPEPARACLLFVDGENGPPDPLLLVQEVERHAGMHPDMKIAYGKWNLLAKNTQKFGDAGFERVLADKGPGPLAAGADGSNLHRFQKRQRIRPPFQSN